MYIEILFSLEDFLCKEFLDYGAGYATVASLGIAAILCLIYMSKKLKTLKFNKKDSYEEFVEVLFYDSIVTKDSININKEVKVVL